MLLDSSILPFILKESRNFTTKRIEAALSKCISPRRGLNVRRSTADHVPGLEIAIVGTVADGMGVHNLDGLIWATYFLLMGLLDESSEGRNRTNTSRHCESDCAIAFGRDERSVEVELCVAIVSGVQCLAYVLDKCTIGQSPTSRGPGPCSEETDEGVSTYLFSLPRGRHVLC